MRKKSFLLIPVLSLGLLVTSCGKQEPTNIEIGKEFKIQENPITISKLEEGKIVRSPKQEAVMLAPKGKKYIYLEVKNPKQEMIFLKLFSKDKQLDADDSVLDFGHDVDSEYTYAYYLVDENTTVDKVIITTPSETEYTLIKPNVTDNKNKISDEAQKILDSYSEKTEIGMVEGFAPYVKGGGEVLNIVKYTGDMTPNRMSNNAVLNYYSEDGKKYIFKITDIVKGSSIVTTDWDNGKVTNILVEDIF